MNGHTVGTYLHALDEDRKGWDRFISQLCQYVIDRGRDQLASPTS